jgi:hypothetical protein
MTLVVFKLISNLNVGLFQLWVRREGNAINSLPITSQSIDREIIVAMNYSEVILKQGD